MRLIDHLKTLGLSNREARARLDSGKVWLNGVPTADPGREVDPAQVELRPQAPRVTVGRDPIILWRDAHLAVVWKPARMLSVPAPKRKESNLLVEVGRVLGTVFPVHRLDEQTSGLIMVARSEPCQTGLKALLEAHEVERRYLAIVDGHLSESEQLIRSNLVRNRGDGKRGTGTGEGKLAITHIQRLRAIGPGSLVLATLQTGRTHQVRIHLAEAGHPILGEPLYASRAIAQRSPRLALHATVLGFDHPITGESLRFEAPLADDLEQLCRDLQTQRPPPKKKRRKRR